MKYATVLPTLLAAFAAAVPAPGVGPPSVSLGKITYGGSGCPQGTADISVTPSSLNLDFNGFNAQIGPNVPVANNRRNCQLNVAIVAPAGWRWTLRKDEYRGYVQLDRGISVNMKTTTYFSGSQDQSSGFTATVNGDYNGPFQQVDQNAGNAPWSPPCGGEAAININLEVALRKSGDASSDAKGLAVTNNLDVHFKQIFSLDWQQC